MTDAAAVKNLLPDPAHVLMTAAADALGKWSDAQQAAMLLTAEICATAWEAGLDRDPAFDRSLFFGSDAERLATAQQFCEFAEWKLPAILYRHGLGPKPAPA